MKHITAILNAAGLSLNVKMPILVFLALTLTQCQKQINTTDNDPEIVKNESTAILTARPTGTVYVAGHRFIDNGTQNSFGQKATLWTNEEAAVLVAPGNTTSTAVFVNDGDVYTAGSEFRFIQGSIKNIALLWKNGIASALTDGSNNADAFSVYVSGTDVYVAVTEYYNDGIFAPRPVAKIWKNGIMTNLAGINTASTAKSVFVSNNDVYVAGYTTDSETGHLVATVWKNGIPSYLTDGTNSAEANSVYVLGNNVFVAGFQYNDNGTNNISSAILWTNGIATQLSNGLTDAIATSVFVSGANVFVAGYQTTGRKDQVIYIAKLWENGIEESLTNGTKSAIANSVFVHNSDVYVAGYEDHDIAPVTNTFGKVWKNGVPMGLTNGNNNSSFAYGIFVQ